LSAEGIEINPISNRIGLNFEIAPLRAAIAVTHGQPIYADSKNLELYLLPTYGWESGIIVIVLRISSKALTIRDKRMVIKRFTTPPPAIKIAAIANIPS
jgi:hypothetical protein